MGSFLLTSGSSQPPTVPLLSLGNLAAALQSIREWVMPGMTSL